MPIYCSLIRHRSDIPTDQSRSGPQRDVEVAWFLAAPVMARGAGGVSERLRLCLTSAAVEVKGRWFNAQSKVYLMEFHQPICWLVEKRGIAVC